MRVRVRVRLGLDLERDIADADAVCLWCPPECFRCCVPFVFGDVDVVDAEVGVWIVAACASCGAVIAGLAIANPLAAMALASPVGFFGVADPRLQPLFFFSPVVELIIDTESESLFPPGVSRLGLKVCWVCARVITSKEGGLGLWGGLALKALVGDSEMGDMPDRMLLAVESSAVVVDVDVVDVMVS